MLRSSSSKPYARLHQTAGASSECSLRQVSRPLTRTRSIEKLNRAIDEVYDWSHKYTSSLRKFKDSFLYPNQHLMLLESYEELDHFVLTRVTNMLGGTDQMKKNGGGTEQ